MHHPALARTAGTAGLSLLAFLGCVSMAIGRAPQAAPAPAHPRMAIGLEPRCVADLPGVPLSLCFTPDTPAAKVQEISDRLIAKWYADNGADGGAYELTTRWNLNGSFSQGTPVTIRWSMPADGLSIPDELGLGIGSASNNLNATFTTKFGSVEAGKNLLRQVFQRWSDLTGIAYVEVTDDNAAWGSAGGATRGDVRIVGRSLGTAGAGTLAYNFFPQSGDMVINTRSNEVGLWTVTSNNRYFRNIIAHEHGHGMGLLHVCPTTQTKLMEPFISTNFDGPQHDDIRAGQRHYGDNFEPNDSSATATAGLSGSGTTNLFNASIDDGADADWFRLPVSAGSKVTVTATPFGLASYQAGPQTSACNTGTTINSLVAQNLVIQVYAPTNLSAPVATQNATAAGSAESIVDLPITTTGTWFVRVSSASGGTTTQLYTLGASVTAGRIGDFNGDGIVNGGDLSILLASWGASGSTDLDGSGSTNGADLSVLLGNWG
jgi:hypothetical protein